MPDQNPETYPIEHTLPPVWQQHIQEVLGQLQLAEGQITQAKAAILDKTQEVILMRNHLAVLVGQLAKAEQLPEPIEPYRLSPDGSQIFGRVRAENQEG